MSMMHAFLRETDFPKRYYDSIFSGKQYLITEQNKIGLCLQYAAFMLNLWRAANASFRYIFP